jgi:hypothetical protein
MLGTLLKNIVRIASVFALCLSFVVVVWAQDEASRTLSPGVAVTGTLDSENPAQVYNFVGSAGQIVDLTITAPGGVVMLVTDNAGQQVEQGVFPSGEGDSVEGVIEDLALPINGVYAVTVLPLAYDETPAEGDFELTLTFAVEAVPTVAETPGATAPASSASILTPGQLVTTSGMQVTLTWDTAADLNLQVRDPVGGTLFWDSRSAPNGGTFGFDANGLCEVITSNPSETASWPAGALATGSYEILVFYRQTCENSGNTNFSVNVTVDGEALAPIEGVLLTPNPAQEQVFVSSYIVNADGSVTQGRSGVYFGVLAVAASELPSAQPIARGAPVEGVMIPEQAYNAYTFTGTTNEIISIEMNRTSGSLDTSLFLLGPSGNVVTFNDDVEFGITDSAISNFRLPVDGQYTVVATRYGQELGGTVGGYVLNLFGPSGDIPAEVLALNLPEGDIEVTLLWNTNADLQLLVRDPSLNSVFDDIPAIPSGGRLVASGNVNCTVSQTQPVSYIYWPTGFLRAGTYEVDVWYQNECNDPRPVTFTLIVTVDGEVVFIDSVTPLPNNQYVSAFTIDVNRQVTVHGGAIMDVASIDYISEVETAPEIASGQPETGTLSLDNPFDVYVFDASVGDVINIGMNLTAGNLDTLLLVLDPNGNVVATNDDAVAGEDTNSLIANLEIPQDGRFIVIATRFGILYGATTGSYQLTLVEQG